MITSKIVLLKSSEIDRASEILARAFDEDRMFRYLGIGEAEQALVNVNALKWFCKMGLRNCQPFNHIYTTAGDLKGVAAWIPPGKSEINIWQVLSMLFALPWKVGWHRLGRSLSLFSTLNERSQHEMSEPHYILSLLGVEPSDRGLQKTFSRSAQPLPPCGVEILSLSTECIKSRTAASQNQ